jgi:succinate dehydrogenase/fumarate reductase flavoprotein subunit
MSTIEEVRAAEKEVQRVVDALRKAGAQDPNHLRAELMNATDEYARIVRELNSK